MSDKEQTNAVKLATRMIDQNEGDLLKVYVCPAGKQTIGRGRNLEDKGISQAESDVMLANDVIEAHARLHSSFAFYSELDETRRAVLMDMYHNLGYKGLLRFRKMLGALQHSDFDRAAAEIKDSRYWQQTGDRAKRNYCIMKFGKYFTRNEAKSYFVNQKV